MKKGKVWLVGAGAGDRGLLTLRGKEVLEQADVVVYDALAGQSILTMIPDTAECIDAGKRAGNHTLRQEETNQILLEKALEGKNVVRLKGGDPFVFGRGGEELELLTEHQIPFEIVPGVTSAFAVPAYQGIPVTHRDFCSSVHIITGHRRKNHDYDIDFEALVRTGGTLIFLMGAAALPDICQGLLNAGMPFDMPAAVLEQGTTSAQHRISATVGTLESVCRQRTIHTPAIIIIGKVCTLAEKFSWYEKLPLAGVKVIVTRPKERSSELASLLRQKGAEVLELPSIYTEPIPENQALTENIRKIKNKSFDWVVFTSPSGVEIFFSELLKNEDVRILSGVQIAVIGQGTQKALLKYGLKADFIPSVYDGKTLGRELAGLLKSGAKILIPRASKGNPELIEELHQADKIQITDIPVYDTVYVSSRILNQKELLKNEEIDFAVFTSASTVNSFAESVDGMDFTKVKAICIGVQTQKAAERLGMQTWTAEKTTLESLADCLQKAAVSEKIKHKGT